MSQGILRRQFLAQAVAVPAVLASAGASLTYKERVDLALSGAGVDRSPFTFWHHFGLHSPEEHAKLRSISTRLITPI
jgi:hypothetical protein